jgi:FtsZ-binding cell division protein ZapB
MKIQSTVISEEPIIKDGKVTLPIVKIGTSAFDETGEKYKFTKESLEQYASTWEGGEITVNHMVPEKGKISKAWFEGEYAYATFDGMSQELIDAVNSAAYRGVSQECAEVEADDDNNILKFSGTGCTFVMYPFRPACSKKDGCGLPVVASAYQEFDDGEKYNFDVARVNNTGNTVKIARISVFLFDDEAGDPEKLKEGISREVGFIGKGVFKIFDTEEDEFELGDEIPTEMEPEHTVTMTVSNFPLYTPKENAHSCKESPGGEILSEDNIDELKSTIDAKDQEIASLQSTIDDLKEKVESTDEKVQAAVNAALKSHDAELQKKAERDAAIEDLKSCMGEDALTEFMESEPSVAVIKSTTKALKSSMESGVGAGEGNKTNDAVKSTYQSGKEIYSKLGLTPEDLEKNGGIEG